MKKLNFWWIDDQANRLDTATKRAIERPIHSSSHRANLIPKEIKNENDISSLIATIADKARNKKDYPDLLLVDQKLDIQTAGAITQHGSSLAVILREKAPEIPLIGFSGANEKDFPLLQREQFIDFLPRESISTSERIPDIYAIAEGYNAIYQRRIDTNFNSIENILSLVKVPKEDEDLLASCIPGMFIADWDNETSHSLSRWIWHVLLGMPGFTYDKLEVATLLGLTPEGFDKISSSFSSCIYQGVFASYSRTRWWLSLVRTTARKAVKANNSRPIWQIGRQMAKQDSTLFSKCYGQRSTDCVPDVVAFRDELFDPSKRVQALLSDTIIVKADSPPPGFEPKRVLPKKTIRKRVTNVKKKIL